MADSDPVQNFIHQLDYSPEEIRRFAQGPHRIRFVRNRSRLPASAIVEAEVIQSERCRCSYVAGDRFFIDLNGGLMLEHCPRRLCIHLISQFALPLSLMFERISEALNPGEFHFARLVRCSNSGTECVRNGRTLTRLRMVR